MKKQMVTAIAVSALGAALVAAPVHAAQSPDAWITTKAKMALLTTPDVSATAVNVDTMDGAVTLHGTVSTQDERARAEAAVKKLDGVRAVRNLLTVVPPRAQNKVADSDAALEERVEKALAAEPALKDGSVKVQSVNAGQVLLAGTVPTLTAHLRALEVASRVPGVRRVESEITSPDRLADGEIYRDPRIKEPTTAAAGARMTDLWITSAVKMSLLADTRTPGLDVNVDSTDGRVTLFGTVESAAAKAAAEEDAKKVAGVTAVDNSLQIVAPAKHDAVAAKDDEVEERVEAALAKASLGSSAIGVEVENGVARLTGSVDSNADRLNAAVAARRVSGVRAIKDDLEIKQ